MYPQILGKKQDGVLKQIGPIMMRLNFHLCGGTAVALRLGHRKSLDFDWFRTDPISDPLRLAKEIKNAGIKFEVSQIDRGTLHGSLAGVKLSLLEYNYPFLKRPTIWPEYHCPIASLDDLACMKLSAIAQRGSKKDFMDLYALVLKYKKIDKILKLYQRKYRLKDIGHVLYGLAYFDDADKERMPEMLWKVDWETVKQAIRGWLTKRPV
jgi:hypothetical protein